MKTAPVLPHIASKNRVIPNDLIRSSLFTVRNHKMPREYYKNELIHTFGKTVISYTGEELRQDDEDVWMQLIHLASKNENRQISNGECFVEFMPYSMLSALGWPGRTQYRDKLKTILQRISATSISLVNKEIQEGIAFSLVRKFMWNDHRGQSLKLWRIWLEPECMKLFQSNHYTKLMWEQRCKLTPLAKWLHAYYSSHAKPFSISLSRLKQASGSSMKQLKHFKAAMNRSLMELTKIGFLEAFFIDPANMVHVSRTEPKASSRIHG